MKRIFPLLAVLSLFLMAATCAKKRAENPAEGLQNRVVLEGGVKTFGAKIYPAWNGEANRDPLCFLDLDKGLVYSVTTAPAHAAEIDIYWSARPFYNDGLLCSPDESKATIGASLDYVRDLKINTWSQQNHTTIARSEELTTAGFLAVQTGAQLLEQWNREKPLLATARFAASREDQSALYLFETAQHKRGIISVTNAIFGPQGAAEIQVKIEP